MGPPPGGRSRAREILCSGRGLETSLFTLRGAGARSDQEHLRVRLGLERCGPELRVVLSMAMSMSVVMRVDEPAVSES